MSDWFARSFGKEYLSVYQHRDEEEAAVAVALIRRIIPQAPGRILDLACGSGRHSRRLHSWRWTVGLDLSADLLEVARAQSPDAPYVRGDMRALPFTQASFGMVVNLFTSFGYFGADAENERVVREVARVLQRDGVFVLDYMNAERVREQFVPEDERTVGAQVVRQRRTLSPDQRYIEKTISVMGRDHTYVERVRLFSVPELREIVTRNGFRITHEFGDYDGARCTPTSPRVILFSVRI